MGKNKRQKLGSHSKPLKGKGVQKRASSGPSKASQQPQEKKKKPHTQLQHTEPTIPFSPRDKILLTGEGDLSFARSLVESHGCKHVTATVYEPREELEAKYPHVKENITAVEAAGGILRYGVDASKIGPVWREVRGKMDRVFFNFPHVGGKSTDVNRQVRYNQELLVAFFKNAQYALAPRGSIIVTLFEGVPYTLWNIRDLARHSGLQVEQSFKFQAKAYPGYRHSRTLGVIKGKNGNEGGGWKGEERDSRSYVFVRKGDVIEAPSEKRKRRDSSGSEDEASADEGGEGADWIEDDGDEGEEIKGGTRDTDDDHEREPEDDSEE